MAEMCRPSMRIGAVNKLHNMDQGGGVSQIKLGAFDQGLGGGQNFFKIPPPPDFLNGFQPL